MKSINILVVDDQHLFMAGICELLALKPQLNVVATLTNGCGVIEAINKHAIDVLLLDLRMPKMDGIQVLQAIKKAALDISTLILTTFDEHDLVLECIRLGALGYLRKDVNLEELVSAIETVARGKHWIQPAVTQQVHKNLSAMALTETCPKAAFVEPLTPNEIQTLRLVAAGYSNNEIAEALHRSSGRIRNIVTNILAKLHVRDRTRAAIKAVELGLI
ncbi:MAG: response regulator transcription factor [Colwellia sp.]|nr:response regulator transcription factor [Colwellia sp.]